MGLPSWASSDYDFEEAFNGYSHGGVYSFTGGETLDFDDWWAQSLMYPKFGMHLQ